MKKGVKDSGAEGGGQAEKGKDNEMMGTFISAKRGKDIHIYRNLSIQYEIH